MRVLLERGASKVYAAARRESDLGSLGAKADSRVVPVHLDVTKPAHLARVASQAEDVQILFNNAGVVNFGSVLDAPSTAFSQNFDSTSSGCCMRHGRSRRRSPRTGALS